jgi:hypothetical protein
MRVKTRMAAIIAWYFRLLVREPKVQIVPECFHNSARGAKLQRTIGGGNQVRVPAHQIDLIQIPRRCKCAQKFLTSKCDIRRNRGYYRQSNGISRSRIVTPGSVARSCGSEHVFMR